ncbi:MAG: pentapeptide repeat-containing protein [Anaerolineae bacterium]|jgi:hypothetical protein|nr:pentapeptide repeat-containing protein [Anaerolineae bacterium]MBT7072502.1 pentapeptide repeat-containing protein [Anaerolineae bacterium]MBT7325719.1 pentapeptide repeat-containing protein [Anaerolineae bacterium]
MHLDKTRKLIFTLLFFIALISSVLGIFFTNDWGGWLLNFGTEITGALITYGLFELVINRQNNLANRKKDLIGKLGSKIRDVAVPASEEIIDHGWHRDGSLKNHSFAFANWEGIILLQSQLAGVDLTYAILKNAELEDSSFAGALLQCVDFEGAWISGCNFHGADLRGANLVGIEGTNTWQHMFNEKTYLPDGEMWKPNTDIKRFTDPARVDFWSSGIHDKKP